MKNRLNLKNKPLVALKIFAAAVLVGVLAISLTACNRGGASSPERAARNFITAFASQNASRIAGVLGLEGDDYSNFIADWPSAPDRNEDRDAFEAFNRRQDMYKSVRLSQNDPVPHGTNALSASVNATITFRFINNRGERVNGEETVVLHFTRSAVGSDWFSNRGNISAVQNALPGSSGMI
ncbi:MAG: hypothetical protein FWD86_01315 [Firmicutes bacterium]|nr:hypothetical protein [Bacillota bacterium]